MTQIGGEEMVLTIHNFNELKECIYLDAFSTAFYLSWRLHWGNLCRSLSMSFIVYMPSFLCNYYSNIACRSYAMDRMGVFVPPTLSSCTQLDEGHWTTIRAQIWISWCLIHTIILPPSPWTSGKAPTSRWYDLPPPHHHPWSSNWYILQMPDWTMHSCFTMYNP